MKCKEWIIPYERPSVPEEIRALGYGSLLCTVLSLRGVVTAAAARRLIEGLGECLYDPMLMTGMAEAAARIDRAVDEGETVAVYGDYDVDGITSACLLTDYLRSRGLKCIPYIPDRNSEGYGLNCAALESLHRRGVSLVITVDCGITAVEEARFASELGLDLIITDHHECKSAEMPEAVAVIDCKREGDNYPNRDLAGVGVALKLVCACEGGEAIAERYCDLVAIGTIADVMPLTGENRCLVRMGLKQLGRSPRPGIAAILHEAGMDLKKLTASAIGFGLAPRLNAAGRLGQAYYSAKLIMCKNDEDAAALSATLCELNHRRQSIETEIWQQASAMIGDREPEHPIVLAGDDWNPGVIGIAASRLAERYSMPAIMICFSGDVGKGSCRSYGGFNLFEALSACSEHLISFGGHALAAGLSISREKLDDFRTALAKYYSENRPAPSPEVQCDLLISDPSLLTVDNVRELDLLEPYGNANPKPIMCMSGVRLESVSAIGGGRHMRIHVRLGQAGFDGVFFSHTPEELSIYAGDRVDVAFTPQINEFRGSTSVQLLVRALRPHKDEGFCKSILAGERQLMWALAPYRPSRAEFARVWRGITGPLPLTEEAIISRCPPGMEEEKYCLCLMAFLEAGLLGSEDGRIFGAQPVEIDGKADLEATSLISALHY